MRTTESIPVLRDTTIFSNQMLTTIVNAGKVELWTTILHEFGSTIMIKTDEEDPLILVVEIATVKAWPEGIYSYLGIVQEVLEAEPVWTT